MICYPKPGQRVRIRYRAGVREHMPLHDRVGVVVIVGRGKPRNHGVQVDGCLYVVPCGNLIRAE